MLDFIRTHQRLMMAILFVLIVPSFVFFGVADYQSFTSRDIVLATVKENKITQTDFNRTWTDSLNTMRQDQGADFDVSKIDTPANRQLWLDKLIDEAVINETVKKGGFAASDNMVRIALANEPRFQDNGQFSLDKYNAFLTGVGATGKQYEGLIRQNEAFQLVLSPVRNSVSLPEKTNELLLNAMTQERVVRLRLFESSAYDSQVTVSDEEILKWYSDNSHRLQIPEYVNADYVVLDKDAALAQVSTPSDADLEAYYKSNMARFSTEERRQVQHIQFAGTDLAKAEQVAEQLKKDPNQWDADVKTYSIDVGTKNQSGNLGLISRKDFPELADAVFALAQPGVTDPVKIGDSYHVFHIVSIQAAEVKSFAQVKDEILNEVKLQLAAEKFSDMATKLTNLVNEHRESLQSVVDDLQLKVRSIDGVGRSALLPKSQVGSNAALGSADEKLFTTPRVREVLYSRDVFAQGYNSGTIEISPAEFLVVRVNKKVAAHVPPLEQVKAEISEIIKHEKAMDLAQSTGAEILADLQKSPSTNGFEAATSISRLMGNLPANMINAVMNAPSSPLPNYVGFELEGVYGIAMIEAIKPGDEELRKLFTQYQLPIIESGVGNQAAKALSQLLRAENDVKILPATKDVINATDRQ